MKAEIQFSDKIRFDWRSFIQFIQHQINRLTFGQVMYGEVSKDAQYMTRIELELKAYRKTGNREHLLNLSNYAYLESQAPENPKFHWDAKVDSVTRGKLQCR